MSGRTTCDQAVSVTSPLNNLVLLEVNSPGTWVFPGTVTDNYYELTANKIGKKQKAAGVLRQITTNSILNPLYSFTDSLPEQ